MSPMSLLHMEPLASYGRIHVLSSIRLTCRRVDTGVEILVPGSSPNRVIHHQSTTAYNILLLRLHYTHSLSGWQHN